MVMLDEMKTRKDGKKKTMERKEEDKKGHAR